MQNVFKHIYRQANDVMGWLNPLSSGHKNIDEFQSEPVMPMENLFADDQLVLFQKRTALFIQRSFPTFAKTLSSQQLEAVALVVQNQAAQKGLVSENNIWHYLTAVIYCGLYFEQDAQYNDMLELIGWYKDNEDKVLLLDRLLDIIDQYAIECEKDYQDFNQKLQYLAEFYTSANFTEQVLQSLQFEEQVLLGGELIKAVFPVRSGLWSVETKQKIIEEALKHANNLGFSVKDSMFYVLISIYFGRGFEASPFYPWAAFLQDIEIPAEQRGMHFVETAQQHLKQLMLSDNIG